MMVGADIMEVKAPAGRKTTVPRLVVNDLTWRPTILTASGSNTSRSSSRVVKSWASPASPATVRTNFSRHSPASDCPRIPARL